MPRRCSVCSHPSRPAIDRALLDGAITLREIREQNGNGLCKSALHRHRIAHITRDLLRAQEEKESGYRQGLLGIVEVEEEKKAKSASYLLACVEHQMEELNGALKIMMVHALAAGDYKAAFATVDKLRESTESVCRLLGWVDRVWQEDDKRRRPREELIQKTIRSLRRRADRAIGVKLKPESARAGSADWQSL
jgi:hypothetical protein